jgi:hypothetical protein
MGKNVFFAVMGMIIGAYLCAVGGFELIHHDERPPQEHDSQCDADQPVSQSHSSVAELPSATAEIHATPEQPCNPSEKYKTFKGIADWTWRFFTDIKVTDAAVAFFTALLAFRTSGLFRETAIAAKAAKDGVEALPTLERAYLFFEVTRENVGLCVYGPKGHTTIPQIDWRIINYGRTPAVISSAGAQLVISSEPKLPFDWNSIPWVVLKSDAKHKGICRYDHILTEDEVDDMRGDIARMVFRFTVTYRDVFGVGRETSGDWEYDGDRERFIPADNGAHEIRT